MPLRPLIAVIGESSLQETLSNYLERQFLPHLKTIPCSDAEELAASIAPVKPRESSPPIDPQTRTQRSGIIRSDWLAKHQTRRPAVALILVPRNQATGDPSSWATLVYLLDAVRAVTKPAKTRVVVVVVQPSKDATPIPDDRISMLARHSGADRGCVVPWTPEDGTSGMQILGALLQTQSAAYYAADAQRRLNSYSQIGLSSVDANLRAAFKMGALAEQRGDWAAAAQLFKEAYGYVGQVSMTGAVPLQRFLEVRAVAEAVNHRVRNKENIFMAWYILIALL